MFLKRHADKIDVLKSVPLLGGMSPRNLDLIARHADEVAVPNTVRGLLSGKNFLFSDRGDANLKGFEDPVRLYEVRWREEAPS